MTTTPISTPARTPTKVRKVVLQIFSGAKKDISHIYPTYEAFRNLLDDMLGKVF